MVDTYQIILFCTSCSSSKAGGNRIPQDSPGSAASLPEEKRSVVVYMSLLLG